MKRGIYRGVSKTKASIAQESDQRPPLEIYTVAENAPCESPPSLERTGESYHVAGRVSHVKGLAGGCSDDDETQAQSKDDICELDDDEEEPAPLSLTLKLETGATSLRSDTFEAEQRGLLMATQAWLKEKRRDELFAATV